MDFHRTPHNTTTAFTLRELVVVIAVLSVLGMTLLTALHQRASWQIKKAQCATNLRQFAQATQLYATENRDKLPEITSGAWAWDFPGYACDAFVQFGMNKRTFYCPGTAPRFNDNDNFINSAPNSLWNFWGNSASSGFRIIGYVAAFNGGMLSLTNQNRTILPEATKLNSFTYLPIPANDERLLLADATISQNAALPGYAWPQNNYASIPGGFKYPHLSPHLKEQIPSGGNCGFKDGHVAWRKFELMTPRTTSGAVFWW